MPQHTVAVTGLNARPDNPGPGLAVVRCLREAAGFNGRIIGLSYDALDPGMYLENYCDAVYLLPYPSISSMEYLERLREIHAREQFSYLIPCLDVELPGFSRAQGILKELGIHTFIPTNEQLRMRNKDNLEQLGKLAGMQTPRTAVVTRWEFFQQCEKEHWRFPLVVKGIFYDAKIVDNPQEAEEAFHAIAAHWGFPVIVQELIKGQEYNLTAVGDGRGHLYNPVMMKKLATTDKGKAWAGVSIEDETLLTASNKLAAELKWRGPLEVEVMRDTEGNYFLIEINPRFPAWIYLSVGTGGNLPMNLLQLMSDTAVATVAAQTGKLYIRYATETIASISQFESLVVDGGMAFDRRNI